MLLETPQPRYCAPPAFALLDTKKLTGAQAEGKRYEAKVFSFFSVWASKNNYEAKVQPWLTYEGLDGKTYYKQPDLLLFSRNSDNLLIIEAKLRYCREGIAQLRCYRELLSLLHPEYHANCVLICRYFSPEEGKIALLSELRPHPHPFAALIWEPQSPLCLTLN